MPQSGSVFFARHPSTGLVKIGWSKTPTIDNPDLVIEEIVSGSREEEARAHNLAENFMIRGDWYDLTREQVVDLSRGFLVDWEWFLARWRTQ